MVATDLYTHEGAQLYDRLVQGDTSEIREILGVIRNHRGAILELGAGSGRVTVPIAKTAPHVTAVDNSPDMLDLLDRKLESERLTNVTLIQADACTVHLDQRFSAVIVAASTITLFGAGDRRLLEENVLQHLDPNGIFVLTLLEVTDDETPHFNEVATPGLRVSVTIDAEKRTRTTSVENLGTPDDDQPTTWQSVSHLVSLSELVDELYEVGFAEVTVSPVMSTSTEVTANCRLYLVVARKESADV